MRRRHLAEILEVTQFQDLARKRTCCCTKYGIIDVVRRAERIELAVRIDTQTKTVRCQIEEVVLLSFRLEFLTQLFQPVNRALGLHFPVLVLIVPGIQDLVFVIEDIAHCCRTVFTMNQVFDGTVDAADQCFFIFIAFAIQPFEHVNAHAFIGCGSCLVSCFLADILANIFARGKIFHPLLEIVRDCRFLRVEAEFLLRPHEMLGIRRMPRDRIDEPVELFQRVVVHIHLAGIDCVKVLA